MFEYVSLALRQPRSAGRRAHQRAPRRRQTPDPTREPASRRVVACSHSVRWSPLRKTHIAIAEPAFSLGPCLVAKEWSDPRVCADTPGSRRNPWRDRARCASKQPRRRLCRSPRAETVWRRSKTRPQPIAPAPPTQLLMRALTRPATVLPSARPATFALTALTIAPIWRMVGLAPSSASVAVI